MPAPMAAMPPIWPAAPGGDSASSGWEGCSKKWEVLLEIRLLGATFCCGWSNQQAATAQMHLVDKNIVECRPLLGALRLSTRCAMTRARAVGARTVDVGRAMPSAFALSGRLGGWVCGRGASRKKQERLRRLLHLGAGTSSSRPQSVTVRACGVHDKHVWWCRRCVVAVLPLCGGV